MAYSMVSRNMRAPYCACRLLYQLAAAITKTSYEGAGGASAPTKIILVLKILIDIAVNFSINYYFALCMEHQKLHLFLLIPYSKDLMP